MAMKQLARRLQPLPLYFILGLTVCLFFLELVTAHGTHSLTLLLDAYHALCNIIVLAGTIISSNHGSGRSEKTQNSSQNSQEELKSLSSLPNKPQMCSETQPGPERSLRNTFGWARIDVLVMLIGCVCLVCLCFSVVLEAVQTLLHISHHDEMHGDVLVLVLGVVALILNLLAYLLIGGYTFHHGSFLLSGDSDGSSSPDEVEKRRAEKRQGLWGLSRDCVGCIVVIVCAVVVHGSEKQVAKFVDPLFSMLSAALVLLLSYPFIKESACILMQTIPDHINIGSLCCKLLTAFPNIVNVHELHVWKLTRGKIYCTAHIIFLNPKEYSKITDDLSRFFLGQGITHVTIQPEFYKDGDCQELVGSGSDCLMECTGEVCVERHCCASRSPSLESVHVDSHKHKGSHRTKSASKSSKPKLSTESSAEVTEDHQQISEDQMKVSEDQNKVSEGQNQNSEDLHKVSEDQREVSEDVPKVSEDENEVSEDLHTVSENLQKASENPCKVSEDQNKPSVRFQGEDLVIRTSCSGSEEERTRSVVVTAVTTLDASGP